MDEIIRFPGTELSPARGFAETPASNTGVKLTEQTIQVGIDWISGTCQQSDAFRLMQFLTEFFRDEFSAGKGGVGFYQQSYRSVLGIVVGMYPVESTQSRQDCYFSIPSKVISNVNQIEIQSLLSSLIQGFNFHYSRLDLKIDDYVKTITPEIAYAAYTNGSVAGFRTHRWICSGSAQRGIGRTLELGRRGKNGAGKFVRIYDKNVESDGRIDATRIEVEFSGERCRQVAELLATVPSDLFAECILCTISGAIDFVERDSSGRLDRATRLPWWDAIVGQVDKISLSLPKVIPSIERVKSWINKQVAPSLATVLASFGGQVDDWWEFFWGAILDGESRMKERHHALVNVSRMQI